MRVEIAPAVRTLEAEETLDVALGPSHDAWLAEARQLLVPAALPTAPFWDRWPVVCYLNDRFPGRLRAERALVSSLRAFVTADEVDALEAEGDRVFRLHLEMDRIARRRGTAAEFAATTAELLEVLELWCLDVERIGRQVRRDELPEEAQLTLNRLGAPARTVCRP
jgi:hypothetical protein